MYKLKKAIDGLKQAPRAWYDMLSSFLISQDFSKGLVDPTLFIRREVDTPMVEKSKLDEDKEGKVVDPSHYRGMIGTILYLTPTFVDADHVGCQDTHRSTSGSMQFLGDRFVSWSSKRQKSDVISSKEAEISQCSVDNQKAPLPYAANNVLPFEEHVENEVIELYFVNTEYQLENIFTKAIGREKIEFLINKLGMRSFTPETLKQLADEVDR
ncbi:hypothetical protein Tco_0201180 [Tanacetum coccineum]